MICGSSSRGVTTRATTPAAIETRMNTIDRFDSRNFRTMRMVRESCGAWLIGRFRAQNDRFPGGEAAEHFELAADRAARVARSAAQREPAWTTSTIVNWPARISADAGTASTCFRLHGNQQAPKHPRKDVLGFTQVHAHHNGPAGRVGRRNNFAPRAPASRGSKRRSGTSEVH